VHAAAATGAHEDDDTDADDGDGIELDMLVFMIDEATAALLDADEADAAATTAAVDVLAI